jgi:phage-related protein
MGKNLIDGLINGIGDMITKVKEKIREVGQKIVAEFKSFFGINSPSTVFADFGRNLLEGLWNGIQNIKDWLIGKLQGLGHLITDAIKSVFGISSPSKVFRDQIGTNLALGLGEGFEAAMKDVSRDMQEAVPTDFDIDANVRGATSGSLTGAGGGGFSLVLHIGTFVNNTAQDLRQLADELSTIMAGEIRRKGLVT